MAPSASPSSRWSLGSKPSAPKSRIVPCVSRTTKSSSPPTGTSGWTRLPSWSEELLGLLVGLVLLGVGRLDAGGELSGLRQQLGLLVARGLGDQLAECLLLGTQLVEADAGRPAPLVGGQESVDERDVLSTGALRSAHTVGVLTKQAKVNHPPRLPVRGRHSRLGISPRAPCCSFARNVDLFAWVSNGGSTSLERVGRRRLVDSNPLWRRGLGGGVVHSNPHPDRVIHRLCERSVDFGSDHCERCARR